MNDHFTITINDDNGVRQFNVHQIIKKATLYIISFIAFVALSALGTILYLNDSVETIETKQLSTQNAYDSLKKQNSVLDRSIKDSHLELNIKKQELEDISNSLSEIEALIGLTHLADSSLQERVNATKMTSEHIATLMQFIPSGSPIEYKGITSKFGKRIHPILKTKDFHPGIDMKAKVGTPLYATADGIVEWAGYHKKSGFGHLIILDHNYGFRTSYGHLKKVIIKYGDFVKKGDLIGYTGNSGLSSGPHLHYEIRFINRAVNPFYFVKWNVENYNDIFLKEKKIPWQSLITATAHIKVPNPTQTLPSSQLALQSKGR